MHKNRSVTIEGFLVGPIWMPAVECYITLNYDAVAQQARTTGKMSLRDHVLRAVMQFGGDFQHCVVAAGSLHIDRVRTCADGKRVSYSRRVPLDRFPSIKDLIHDDPDWLPGLEDPGY
jgi:hypothetical protein